MGDRAERSERAREWAAGTGPSLVGRPLTEAQAAAVAAGLHTKVEKASGASTQEFGIGRVRITVDEQDLVTRIAAG